MGADLAILGARIRTMDPALPWASAVAVRDGVIVAVGDDAEVRRECDASTRLIDGAGLVLTPGLTDSHQHLFQGAELAQGVDFDRVGSLEGFRDRLRGRRTEVGTGAWVLGFALAHEAFEGRAYHHTLVDEAAGNGPLLVYALDLHTAFVNEHALRLAGVDGPGDLGDGAVVVCDDAGRPTGELRERSAIDLVLRHLPAPTRQQRLDPQRCGHGMRAGDLSAAGALVVLGSDWPVAPFDPRVGFFAARLRRAPTRTMSARSAPVGRSPARRPSPATPSTRRGCSVRRGSRAGSARDSAPTWSAGAPTRSPARPPTSPSDRYI